MPDAHLSEEQLARFQDGTLPAGEAAHLEWCAECKTRLRDLDGAIAAYAEYRDSLRQPALPPPPKPWASLAVLHTANETRQPRIAWRWWPLPALAAAVCVMVAVVMILRHPPDPSIERADALLARSAAAELPRDRTIALRLHGRTLVRPAVLTSEGALESDPGMKRLASLFARARYSWREPLSARTFQSWRSSLPAHRDSVTVLHSGSPGQAYRVRTESAANVLRSASLTLRGADLRPVSGDFEFEGEQPLEMEEAGAPASTPAPPAGTNIRNLPDEIPASPADTLHVLAALNQIGADVGDPVTVSNNGHSVQVSATGLSVERRRQVAEALRSLPRVKLDLDAAPSAAASANHPTPAERNSTGMPASLRKQFEDKLGGPIALQEATDRALEAGDSAVSVAHALAITAEMFPPTVEATLPEADREVLHRLRQGYVSGLRQLTAQLRAELKPLLPPPPGGAGQPPRDLFSTVRALDAALNRLLAGSYTQPEGEAALNSLVQQLDSLDRQLAEVMQ